MRPSTSRVIMVARLTIVNLACLNFVNYGRGGAPWVDGREEFTGAIYRARASIFVERKH
jgi:hypothetical protein